MNDKAREALNDRITAYLAGGGLFNPELANHTAVRDLLIDCRAALQWAASQQAAEGEPVAFEFFNPATGHAIVDYSRQTHVGPLTKEMGYEARPLGYINPPPAAVKPGDPVPLWQALEALDSLEESSRGDAPYNHFAAGLVRSALEQSAAPPATQGDADEQR
jgi:hypothetical protein